MSLALAPEVQAIITAAAKKAANGQKRKLFSARVNSCPDSCPPKAEFFQQPVKACSGLLAEYLASFYTEAFLCNNLCWQFRRSARLGGEVTCSGF